MNARSVMIPLSILLVCDLCLLSFYSLFILVGHAFICFCFLIDFFKALAFSFIDILYCFVFH